MRLTAAVIALLLLAACSSAGSTASSGPPPLQSPSATAATADRTLVIADCEKTSATPQYEPRRMTVACGGDAVFILHSIRYKAWGRTTAAGDGVQRYNDCRPTCASGHPIDRQVSFRLFRPASQHGTTLFGCLVLRGGTDESYTLLSAWPAARCRVPGHIAG